MNECLILAECTLRIELLKELIDDDDRSDSPSVFFLSKIKCFHCHILKCLDNSLEYYKAHILCHIIYSWIFHGLYHSAFLSCDHVLTFI